MATKKKASKKATKKAVRKSGEAGGGRPSKFNGKKIVKLVNENPRRSGTHGHKTFQFVRWRKDVRCRDQGWRTAPGCGLRFGEEVH
jgi:transposase